MNWKNNITELLTIEYPIIQAPMFGVATPEMVAATSKAKCLGSLPLADLSADKCAERIRETKKLTNKIFAVNIFAHKIPNVTNELNRKFIKIKRFLEDLANKHNLKVEYPNIEDLELNGYHEQIEAIIAENCKILSFTFGNLDKQSIEKLKENGIILIGTCTSVNEAIILENAGIDIICVQGIEAGGHRGSFTPNNILKIGGLSLLAKVSENVKVPIIYAGGIYNEKTLLASKTLGASGFQIGSLLLGSKESALKKFQKERLRQVKEADLVLTNSFSGRYARGIKNIFTETIDNSEYVLPYPYQNKLTRELRNVSKANQNLEFINIWLGQSINDFSEQSTTDILKNIIKNTGLYVRKGRG